MRGATEFATQPAGIVALVVRVAAASSPVNAALAVDPAAAPGTLDRAAEAIGSDTAVWFVADVLRRLVLDAHERGQRTASLQASPGGRTLDERLGLRTAGSLHPYKQGFAGA